MKRRQRLLLFFPTVNCCRTGGEQAALPTVHPHDTHCERLLQTATGGVASHAMPSLCCCAMHTNPSGARRSSRSTGSSGAWCGCSWRRRSGRPWEVGRRTRSHNSLRSGARRPCWMHGDNARSNSEAESIASCHCATRGLRPTCPPAIHRAARGGRRRRRRRPRASFCSRPATRTGQRQHRSEQRRRSSLVAPPRLEHLRWRGAWWGPRSGAGSYLNRRMADRAIYMVFSVGLSVRHKAQRSSAAPRP